MSEKNSLRKGLGIPAGGLVALIIYESATERAFVTQLPELGERYSQILVFPVGNRARKHLMATCAKLMRQYPIMVVDDLSIEEACDELILFRVNEDVLRGRKIPIRILDANNRWLTAELSRQ